ncbi:MAG: ribosomal RNA adenine dimethylase domain-containing protein [Lentisphaerae bacterium]|nr:ribosomal RNA adenine dimethylase domain-containing protein [Lentisphaerota bacterium]MCP4100886.1 ribosomal RNA adenine dimethylase domain-containing protein [Lentisphaerota bacterium]
MKSRVLFQRFLSKPATIGSLYPSSSELCREMLTGTNIESAQNVIELGPGTGVITMEILTSIGHQAKFFAVELDSHIYEEFRRHWPHVKIYHDSAENLGDIMKKDGMTRADVIVSGLPWAAFPQSLQKTILKEVVESLPENGYFTTFAYLQGMMLPAARRFKKMLKKEFSEVSTSKVIWKNIPPAFVYRCRK